MEGMEFINYGLEAKQEAFRESINPPRPDHKNDGLDKIRDYLERNNQSLLLKKRIQSESDYIQQIKEQIRQFQNEYLSKVMNKAKRRENETTDFCAGAAFGLGMILDIFAGEVVYGELAEIVEKYQNEPDKKEQS